MAKNKSRKLELPSRSKLKKDPGIPRLPDLKLRLKTQEKQHALPQVPRRTDLDSAMASEPTLTTLAQLATDLSQPDIDTDSASPVGTKTKEQLGKHYVRTLHKVIDQSDIIVLVLDARDPDGCRSRLVEEEVLRRESEGKRLVFVLNKIDLVPRDNAQAWLRYLRHTTPTLPFRSASNNQRTHLASRTAPALLRLLKAHKPTAQSITVGIVGYPNVGKSSLINSLKRAKVCAVAAQPGHTKDLQSVQLERGIRILDSPGVVFDENDEDLQSSGKARIKSSILLRNAVRAEDVDDPIAVVEEILSRTNHEMLQKIYNLPPFASPLEFLTTLALTSGRLLKGGTPDILASARQVLTDWNHQKIPYFSVPPSIHPSSIPSTVSASALPPDSTILPGSSLQPSNETLIAPGAETVGQAKILTAFSKPFELAGLFNAADAGAFGTNPSAGADDDLMLDGETYWDAQEEIGMDEQEQGDRGARMDEDGDVATTSVPRKRPHSPSVSGVDHLGGSASHRPKRQRRIRARDPALDEAVIKNHNSLNRRMLKREAKKARRAAGRAARARAGNSGMDVDADMLDGAGLEFTFMADVESA